MIDRQCIHADYSANLSVPPAMVAVAQIQPHAPVILAGHPVMGAVAKMLGTAFVTDSQRCRKLLYNAFDLQLDKAWIAPVHGRVRVKDSAPGGFVDADRDFQPLLPVATQTLPGASRIWCSWSMTNPSDSKRAQQAATPPSCMRSL